jgi:hypothetical protein
MISLALNRQDRLSPRSGVCGLQDQIANRRYAPEEPLRSSNHLNVEVATADEGSPVQISMTP